MKRLILILTSIFISQLIIGQKVTYTASDLAITGDTYDILKIQYDSTSTLSVNDIDPDLWDFSNITPITNDIINILSKDEFPQLVNLPEGTMVMKRSDDNYICMYLNGNMLEMLGMLFNLNDTLTAMIFPEPQNMLHFPLTIGDAGSSNITFPLLGTPDEFGLEIPFHDSLRFDVNIIATSNVEDTGMVTTSKYSKPAFKISNSTIFTVDAWAHPTFGDWYLFQENIVADSTKMYQYYNPDYGIPMVEINLTWNDSILSYKMVDDEIQNITSIRNTELTVYPNPVKSNKRIHFSNKTRNPSLFDITGKLIIRKKGIFREFQLPDIPKGYYILKFESPNITKRLVIN
jgi:hypothetical protein